MKPALCLCLALSTIGCTRSIYIPPEELPQLNGSHTAQVGTVRTSTQTMNNGRMQTRSRSTPIFQSTTTHVITTEGVTETVAGPFHAVVHTRRGEPSTFRHPVLAEIHDEALTVRGSNRPAETTPLYAVEHVEVRQNDPMATTLLIGGIGVGVLALAYLVIGPDSFETETELSVDF